MPMFMSSRLVLSGSGKGPTSPLPILHISPQPSSKESLPKGLPEWQLPNFLVQLPC